MSINSFDKYRYTTLVALVFAAVFLIYIDPAHADILLPGEISTCGELSISGTYTLIATTTAPANTTCFTISSDNVIIDGQGVYSIQGSSASLPAIDARKYSSGSLVEGANGYTNLMITGLTVSGYTTLVDSSGNSDTTGSGQNNGYGGNGGSVSISYSTTTASNFISNGGDATTKTNGGDAGSIVFTDQNLDVSNKNITVLGGMGTAARGASGGLTLTYSGTINKSQLTASDLGFLNVNGTTTTEFYNWTVSTSSPTANWNSITSSADGMKLAAVAYSGQIYTSSDAGVTWFARDISRNWTTITSSADGRLVRAGTNINGFVYISDDSGISWMVSTSSTYGNWTSIAASTDGMRLVSSLNTGQLYTSTDSGVTWLARDLSRAWSSVTSSVDGVKLAATVNGGKIYTSTDSGLTWIPRESNRAWSSITSSADGTRLAATVSNGQIYISTDSGATWTARDSNRYWTSITSSADGTRLAAVASTSRIYTSFDSGISWIARESNRTWSSISSSADGMKLRAGVFGGQIFTMQNALQTLVQYTPIIVLSPLSGANTSWSPYVNWGSATSSCSYTLDGGVPNVLTCANNGTDIPIPSYGTHILVVTGTDASNVTTSKMVTFTLAIPLYLTLPLESGTYSSTTWTPTVVWDRLGANNITSCLYSYDNWGTSTSVDCSKNGAGILSPSSIGTTTLSVRAINSSGGIGNDSATFYYSSSGSSLIILSPISTTTPYLLTAWQPTVQWGTTAVICKYSYNNWVSSTTVNCANNGSDIFASTSEGISTLYIRAVDESSNITEASSTFPYSMFAARESNRKWWSVTSSADGMKLAAGTFSGFIYTSNDGGVTWAPRSQVRSWYAITSSADGTKLAAGYSGKIYLSRDSGVTWFIATTSPILRLYSIAMSADGSKIVAAPGFSFGFIYISDDFGYTWTPRLSSDSWAGVTCSADCSKISTVKGGYSVTGNIYTSLDGGITWFNTGPVTRRESITSSADGTKIATGHYGVGQIYTSTDSGFTWNVSTTSPSVAYYRITSSADGTRIAATKSGNSPIYISLDSGLTWNIPTSSPTLNWYSIKMSADGTKLVAVVLDGQIYTYSMPNPTPSVDVLLPQATTSNLWSPYISWGTAVYCEYSIDGGATSSVPCANTGSFLTRPSYGTHTLVVSGQDVSSTTVSKSVTFTYSFGVNISSPVSLTSYIPTTWAPSVRWDRSNSGTISLCQYSYNNWVSSTTVDCANNGSDILAPTVEGTSTLYVRATSNVGDVANASSTFSYLYNIQIWTAHGPSRKWNGMASSADGTKIVAVTYLDQIYTSIDSGVTWTARDSSRKWNSVTSSADGTKLAAVVNNGQIYTSIDSGVTWAPRESSRQWYGIASSADGTKLAATVSGGQIYTSTDSGITWAPRESSRSWYGITSSADGTKLAAVVAWGRVYTSTDSGVTWTAYGPSPYWTSITSSADGTKLAAVVNNGQIYTSTDSGVTWNVATSSITTTWNYITSSADGSKLAAVVLSSTAGKVYISYDFGVTWYVSEASPVLGWYSISSSADGNKLVAGAGGYNYSSQIYTSIGAIQNLAVDVLLPQATTSNLWSPYISWGTAVYCEYSIDGSATSSVPCANTGSFLTRPSYGTHTLVVSGQDVASTTVSKSVTFTYSFGVNISSPAVGGLVSPLSWIPLVKWDQGGSGTISLCQYSYNNWVSSTTVDCANNGSDILAPTVEGTSTLYVRATDNVGTETNASSTFVYTMWQSRDSIRSWQSITSSADGTKLAAVANNSQIYTSVDSGVTWIARDSSRYWYGIASSADGTKLAATVSGGQIYTSTDSGVTWAVATTSINASWSSITSSADGTKLVGVGGPIRIYYSLDSGITWTESTNSPSLWWTSVTSSADGSKVVAVHRGGYIYTSTDYGITWTARDSVRQWYGITSSADGTKLAAVAYGGQIYTSVDSGLTWTARDSNRGWRSITSSDDGTKLIAVAYSSLIYTSADSGVTWVIATSSPMVNFLSITSSADGTKLAAIVNDGQIYTYSSLAPVLSIDILLPQATTSASSWSPYISWGTATTCQYSIDGGATSTVSCSNTGSFLARPSYGTHTLVVSGTDAAGTRVTKSTTFTRTIAISAPVTNSSLYPESWSPSVMWYANGTGSTAACSYSYDNWVSTTTVNCANNGTDILPPITDGTSTLYVIAIDASSTIARSSVTFGYSQWVPRDSARYWWSITSSADGTKLAAVVGVDHSGQIYTSTNSGLTWTARESTRVWGSIASSADGNKLVASVLGGQLYSSVDSGLTWTPVGATGNWYPVAMSSDGIKLVAAQVGGQIYTSTDSGLTWTARDSSRNWFGVTSSADGTKLAAVVNSGQIYTSTDSGVTWTARESSRTWGSIASSADGTKLAAVVNNGGQIYVSTTSGEVWVASETNRDWYGITSSADGTKLAAVVSGGQIYTSVDSGLTWTGRDSNRGWYGVTSSADGNKLAAVVGYPNGQIYTYSSSSPSLSVDILLPQSTTTAIWSPYISWGTSVLCQYSIDGGATTTVSCSNTGSSLTRPAYGTHTLVVSGTDAASTTVTKSAVFNFSAYTWCGTADSNWVNQNNWYTSSSCITGTGDVPNSSTAVYLYGSVSPVATSSWIAPLDIDTSGLTGSASTVGVIFAGTTTNTVNIYGNATFTASSSNAGNIYGNATLNTTYYSSSTPTTSTLTISGSSLWRGSISGTIYASDGTTPITNIVFTESSNNQGTITGNPSFNNAVPFTMGTVNGTVTLTRPSQTISGGTVTTLIKTSTSTDTLYLTSGTVLNVTNLTLGGVDANNLLTLRSTIPGTAAILNITASTSVNIQNIHLKDIHNIGTTIDLRGKNAFDDGGNTGFTFDTGNTLGSYVAPFFSSFTRSYSSFVTARNAVIAAIFQRNTAAANASQQQSQSISTSRSSSSFTPGTLNKISLPFIIPAKLDLKPVPTFGGTDKNSFSFTKTIDVFLFSPLPSNISKSLNISPSLKLFMAGVGIKSAQDIISLRFRSIDIPATSTVQGIYNLTLDSKPLKTTLSTPNTGTSTIIQQVTVETGKTVVVSLIPLTKGPVKATVQGKDIIFTTPKGSDTSLAIVTLPTTPGRYYLTSDSAAFTLAIDVISPVKEVPVVVPKVSLWKRVLGWFGW